MHIVRAQPEQAEVLKDITIRSKGYWGYTPQWLAEWRARLRFTPDDVARHHVYAALVDGRVVGWYGLIRRGDTFILDHLWVLPEYIGRGIGRRLFQHARDLAEVEGGTFLELEADPNARPFYERMGMRYLRDAVGDMGRALPILGMELKPAGAGREAGAASDR